MTSGGGALIDPQPPSPPSLTDPGELPPPPTQLPSIARTMLEVVVVETGWVSYKLAANAKKEPDDESLPSSKHKRASLCLPPHRLLKMAKLTKRKEKKERKKAAGHLVTCEEPEKQ